MKAKSPMSFMKARQKRTLKRTNSCPDWHEIEEIVAAKNKPIAEEPNSKGNFFVETHELQNFLLRYFANISKELMNHIYSGAKLRINKAQLL